MKKNLKSIVFGLSFLLIFSLTACAPPAEATAEEPPAAPIETEALPAEPASPPTDVPTVVPTAVPTELVPTEPAAAEEMIAGGWWDESPLPGWEEKFEKVDVGPENAYYEVFKVMDNIYAIFEPYNWQQVISYLIIGDEKAMLFDTGMDISPIDQAVKKLTDKPVFVVLSHSHFDHVGGAHRFDEVWGMDEPWANQNASGGATAYAHMFTTADSFWSGHVPESFDLAAYKIENYTVTHFYKEGDIIDLGNRQLEVVAAPGHSPDGIVLLDRENRLMWTGDVFYVGPLFAFLEEADMDTYTQTAAKLADFADEVDYLLPTHNTTMEPSSWLVKMDAAFKSLASGEKTDYTEGDGYWEYAFDGFQIWAKVPAE